MAEKTNGSRNRTAGKRWELAVIKKLKERNLYPYAVSTRSENRNLDAEGIDIVNRGEIRVGMMADSIQNKTSTTTVPYPKLLGRIREAQRPGPVVFHQQTAKSKKGVFRTRDEFAITYFDNYIDLMACRKFAEEVKKYLSSSDSTKDNGEECRNRLEELLRRFEL